MAGSGTGKCLGWFYPVLLILLAVQTSTLLHLAIKGPAQPIRAGFWASLHC